MSIYAKFHRYFVWPLIEKRNSLYTRNHLNMLHTSEKWSREQLHSFQWNRLKIVLQHAYDNTVFYKERFDEIGMKPEDILSFEDFRQIPPVSRDDMNYHLENMIASNVPENERHFDSTGGSTGLATQFVRDKACLSIKKASEYRFNMWAGWEPGEKLLAYWPALADFSGEPKKNANLRPLLYTRHLMMFAGRLNEEILSEHVKAFKRFRPDLIRAFPSALQKFAEYVSQSGSALPQPRAVICVGEPLLQSQRELFSEIFGCDVFNCYVSRECGNIACECSAHDGLHIAEELICLEIDNRGKGEFGEILLTDLWNMGMPLIRYRIQDAARWVEGNCACGIHHRRIGVDAARLSNFLVSPVDGSYVSGSTLTHYLLAEGPGVGRVKLIQDSMDHITVLTAEDEASSKKAIEHIKSRLEVIFKGQMHVDFRFVNDIPLLKSGKYSFVERKF